MSETNTGDSSESQNETDLTALFSGLGASNGERRCSTTRKQQERLEQAQNPPEADAESTDNEVADDAPAAATPTSRPPETARSSRRKQTTPLQRAARFQREILALQRSTQYMIPRLSFGRVVREILMQHCVTPFRVTIGALEALQASTEMFLTQRFQDSYLMTMHRQRVTLEVRDMALMAFICKQHGQL